MTFDYLLVALMSVESPEPFMGMSVEVVEQEQVCEETGDLIEAWEY